MSQPQAAANDKLAAALDLARRGFRVFPLEPNGRTPVIGAWPEKATTDEAQIARWWTCPHLGWPQDFNIGIATEGFCVVDVDVKNGKLGLQSLASLSENESDARTLPKTLTSVTPSGGRHLYFTQPDAPTTAGRLGDGLDTRGKGGFVVAPGSVIGNNSYRWENENATPVPSPSWLRDKLSQFQTPPNRASAQIGLDGEPALRRAAAWLDSDAPLAIEGAGGDDTTYRVAARLKDFGVSETAALDLLLARWNDRCSPPWALDELERKVQNAYRYGQETPGSKSPESDFADSAGFLKQADALAHEAGTPPASPETLRSIAPRDVRPFDPKVALQPRPFVFGDLLIKRRASLLIAPAGVGKSTFTIAAALAIATGREDILGIPVPRPGPVWIFNNEDDLDEMQLRLYAAMQRHNVAWADLKDRLAINSGQDRRLTIAKRTSTSGTSILRPADAGAMTQHIRERGFAAVIVDPFVETHEANENDNVEIAQVGAIYRAIAIHGDCAMWMVHHTRKPPSGPSDGYAGDMDSGRGASALSGVVRAAATLYTMSEKDAANYGVARGDRRFYVRLDGAKANLSLMSGEPRWFKRLSEKVDVAGGETESVGVLAAVELTRKGDRVKPGAGSGVNGDPADDFPAPAGFADPLAVDLVAAFARELGRNPDGMRVHIADAIARLQSCDSAYEGRKADSIRKAVLRGLGEESGPSVSAGWRVWAEMGRIGRGGGSQVLFQPERDDVRQMSHIGQTDR